MSIRRRPASALEWVSEDWLARQERTSALAAYDDLLMEVENWNQAHGAETLVPWALADRCLRGGAQPDDGAITGTQLIEYLLGEQEALMRPRLEPRMGLRAVSASRH